MIQFHHIHLHADGRHEDVEEYAAQFARSRALVIAEPGEAQANTYRSRRHDNPEESLFQAAQKLNEAVGIALEYATEPPFECRSKHIRRNVRHSDRTEGHTADDHQVGKRRHAGNAQLEGFDFLFEFIHR